MSIRLIKSAILCLSALSALVGCDLDPPHDNIFDPDNPNYRPVGNLLINVRTLDLQMPIADATVLLPELKRLGTTDRNGEVLFSELPLGEWWVVAYRDVISDTVYGRDSVMVTIGQAVQTDTLLGLDALPTFTSVKVNSITTVKREGGDEYKVIVARLKARVIDPDGAADLERVEWKLLDTLHDPIQVLMHGILTIYQNPDSAYWWAEIPSDSFPGNTLSNSLTLPFTFEAFDEAEKSSESTAYLARVINDVPTLQAVGSKPPPHPDLRWQFYWDLQFPNIESFYFLVRIYKDHVPPILAYEEKVDPDISGYFRCTVKDSLESISYLWEVLAVDLFGNYSRSVQNKFTVSHIQ